MTKHRKTRAFFTFTAATMALLVLASEARAASAKSGPLPSLTATFAECTGRLAARAEFERLAGRRAQAEQAEGEARALSDLAKATTPDGRGADVLASRIEAKTAHRRLLHASQGARDWASVRAEGFESACRDFLL